MHIIGIEIENGCNPKVIKNLSPGEYPFGNYQLPNDNDYRWRNGSEQSDRLYQIYPTMPQISVSCIIGMNGSGKTTLLDVLFRIINNYAAIVCKNTKEYGSPIDTYEVEYAEGLNAKLYFEVEGNIGYINSTYKCGDNKEPVKFVKIVNEDYSRHLNDYQSFLSSLFYTIGINYSIHSMRFIERQGNKEGFNEWMGNIFINEDNYLVPLTFAPYRVDGVIDINREDYLACRRLTTLSILLHSQGKQLMKGYRPSKISFKPKEIITENYLLEERKMNKLALRKGVPYSYAGIIKGFKNLWEPIVAKYGIFYKDKWDIITESLAYETTRICLIYPNYGDVLGLKTISKHEENDGHEDTLRNAHFQDVIDKIISSREKSVITADIDQILTFLSNRQIKLEESEIFVKDLLELNSSEGNSEFKTYDEVYRLLPPLFFDIDLHLQKDDEKGEVKLSEMSSGEKQMMYSNSALLYHIYKIANSEPDTKIIPYKHINIILDEVELYYHPEFQRKYIASFIDMLAGLHINRNQIKSINMIIATHSPFILSDVPKENVICLCNGKSQTLGKESYCANIYDLLNDSFFLDYPMGEVAKRILDKIISEYDQYQNGIKFKSHIRENISFYKYLINIISDQFIKETITTMISSVWGDRLYDKSWFISRKTALEGELNKIINQLNEIDEENRI